MARKRKKKLDMDVRFSKPDQEMLLGSSKKSRKMKVMVPSLIFLLLALIVVIPVLATVLAKKWDSLGKLQFKPSTGELRVQNSRNQMALKGMLGRIAKLSSISERIMSDTTLEYKFADSVSLVITTYKDRCYDVTWSGNQNTVASLMDCFEVSDLYHLYGGSELHIQPWPLDKANVKMQPYLPADTASFSAAYGSVLERYWFTSRGGAVYVDNAVPLHVSLNSQQLCLKADPTSYPQGSATLQLNYKVCLGTDAKDIHKFVTREFFDFPTSIPDKRMIAEPIWSTWARYKSDINQSAVLNFAKQIVQHQFPYSQIEIDDKYSTAYGDFDFNVTKFPDATHMIEELHNNSFRVTAWVQPFANPDSRAFREGIPYWVTGSDGKVPGLMKWWNGIGVALDTTDSQGREWFHQRLETFRSFYKLDSFKFDAGELSYLPVGYKLRNVTENNPSSYSTNYVSLATMFGDLTEVRVGYRSQNHPLFVRMLDKESRWDENNGLRSVIPATLTFGILGYPFVLPDMIGGNAYGNDTVHGTVKPEKELYIRWLQVNVFLPAMQFSIPPWDYDNETINIAKEMMSLRRSISDVTIQLALQATHDGDPIIRPLWWVAPNDPVAQKIDTEFMVGDHYLVAPVLMKFQETQGNHKVYLPRGSWREEFGSKTVIHVTDEGTWLNYNVTLMDIPYFSCLAATD